VEALTTYVLTRTCIKCGFVSSEPRKVYGDFDGWDDCQKKMQPRECPYCIHTKKLKKRENAQT
jgi:hypothetical protein